MQELSKQRNVALLVLVSFMVLVALLALAPTAHAAPAKTVLDGVKTEQNVNYTENIVDTVIVEPAYGRKVVLSHKDPKTNKYVVDASFKTANKKLSRIKIIYPSFWKTQYKSTWRIKVPAVKKKVDDTGKVTQKALAATKQFVTVKCKLLSCKAATVMDASTGELLYNYNATDKRKVASLTKMMTSTLLVENCDLDYTVSINKEAANTPWKYGFSRGMKLTVGDALYAMMLPSANEVATAAGIRVSGSTSKFVKRMNKKAKNLGCKATNYKNAHGLDQAGEYSTAYDQAVVARYVMTSKTTKFVRKAARTKTKTIRTLGGTKFTLNSTNKLLGTDWEPLGLKTGTEDDAGYCFAGAFRVKGKTYITVVLGAKSDVKRWTDTERLVKYTRYAVRNSLEEFDLY